MMQARFDRLAEARRGQCTRRAGLFTPGGRQSGSNLAPVNNCVSPAMTRPAPHTSIARPIGAFRGQPQTPGCPRRARCAMDTAGCKMPFRNWCHTLALQSVRRYARAPVTDSHFAEPKCGTRNGQAQAKDTHPSPAFRGGAGEFEGLAAKPLNSCGLHGAAIPLKRSAKPLRRPGGEQARPAGHRLADLRTFMTRTHDDG